MTRAARRLPFVPDPDAPREARDSGEAVPAAGPEGSTDSTTAASPRGHLRRSLLAGALALALAACSQGAGPTPPPPSGKGVETLVLGSVESDLLASFEGSLALTVHDGSQSVEDYDLVLLDGDHHAPAELRDDPVVRQALDEGLWVLLLDATAEHKRDGLGDRLLFASDGTSPAYSAHTTHDAHGRPFVQIVEYPAAVETVEDPAIPADGERAAPLASRGRDASAATAFADTLLERIATPARPELLPLADGADTLPSDVIYAQVVVSVPTTSWQIQGSAADFNRPRPVLRFQHPNYTVENTFTVILGNHDDPHGDFQWVLVKSEVTAAPRGRDASGELEPFLAARVHTPANTSVDWDEWGWFQTHWRQGIETGGLASPDDRLHLVHSSPQTENGVTEVETGWSFTIGYSDGGAGAQAEYTHSETHAIEDWKISNESTNDVASWYFRSQYPFDNDVEGVCQDGRPCKTGWQYLSYCTQEIYRLCYIRMDPNDLSIETLELATLATYQTENPDGTERLVDGWADFTLSSEHGMIDLFCWDDFAAQCAVPLDNEASARDTRTYHLDLGAVIPLPVTSLTFSPDPVAGGATATGTVTLSEPARYHTTVRLSSTEPTNAPVPSEVLLAPGETSKTFTIDATANGVPAGGSVDAVITAYNVLYPAVQAQGRLTITH